MIDKEFLKNEIRNVFNLINGDKLYIISSLPDNYRGYVVSDSGFKGVGIEIDKKYKDFKYSFESIKLIVKEKSLEGRQFYMLELMTKNAFDIDAFSVLCIDFLNPGHSGKYRQKILENPQNWVNNWKTLIGNKIKDSNIYAYLGELIVLHLLLKNGEKAILTSQGSHDIETPTTNIEVKTTGIRYQSLIEIHSKYQLQRLNNNPLYLYFVRLEDANFGISINSMISKLKELKYDISSIEKRIEDLNSDVKEQCYKIDEIRKYKIDDSFPKITDETFVDGKLPENIVKVVYTVDLDGIEYEKVKTDIE